MLSLRVEDWWWLLLALAAAPAVVAAVRWLHAMSRARAWSVGALRTVLLTLLALALAGASAVRETNRLAVIAVVDVSESVRRFASVPAAGPGGADGQRISALDAARDFLQRAAEGREPDDLLGVVAFDGASLAVAAPRAADPADLSLDVRQAEGTDIAKALTFASSLFPPGAARRLVLISDGVQTSGDALGAADAIAGQGRPTPIDVAALTYDVTKETLVESVDAPPSAAEGGPVAVRVALSASAPASGTLRLLREGVEIDINGAEPGKGRRVEFGPGRRVETVQAPLPDGRVHRFEAVFEPDTDARGAPVADTLTNNNRGEAFTITPGKGAALLVDGVSRAAEGGAGRTLEGVLERAGVRVRVVGPDGIPSDPLSLQAFDLVILENVAAEEVPQQTQEALARFVSDLGGGLIMVGGPDSFGAGGWKGSALEPILPVRLDLPEQLLTPSAALMLVMDSSGSMGRGVMGGMRTQQQIANEGAALAVRSLDKRDLVGVIEFNSGWSEVIKLGPNRDPAGAAARIRAISPGGGTNIWPALEEAGQRLIETDAPIKHIILLTDGVSQGDSAEGVQIAGALAERGITVSAIAVGDGADTNTLRRLAQAGRGQFYAVTNPSTLPRVFLKETRVVRKPLVREAPFEAVDLASGSPITLGIPGPMPILKGLVLTRDRDPEADGAAVVRALAASSGEPLLSHWSVGLGQAAAWTSDASNWASNWLNWPGFAVMWGNMARVISRAPFGREYDVRAAVEGDELVLRVGAFTPEGEPLDLLRVAGTVYGPDGSRTSVTLAQVGPGEYETRTPARATGGYIATLNPRQGDRSLAPIVAGASRTGGAETRRLRSDASLLRQLAARTGGRVLDLSRPEAANLFDRDGMAPSRAGAPLWRLLLVWAMVALVFDIATRRVAWDRFDAREVAADWRRRAAERRLRAEGAATAVGALKKARRAAEARVGAVDAARGPAPTESVPLAEAPPPVRGRAPAAPVVESPPKPAAGEGAADGATGLLAAKRRAQRQIAERSEGEGS